MPSEVILSPLSAKIPKSLNPSIEESKDRGIEELDNPLDP
jgi:hypothetical protein